MKLKTAYIDHSDCAIRYGKYENDRIAMLLVENETEIPLAKLTVNIPEIDCPPNHVFIKNYSENEGVLDELIRHNIVKDTGLTVNTGFVVVHLCELIQIDGVVFV